MSKFRFGDKVIILKDLTINNWSRFEIGTVGIIDGINYKNEHRFRVNNGGYKYHWYNEDELELYVEQPCETSNNIAQDSSTRPCLYLEEKATFHRWVDETRLIMKFDAVLPTKDMWRLKHEYEDIGVISAGADAVPLTTTFALIELKDGSMKKVPPEEIRFVTEE